MEKNIVLAIEKEKEYIHRKTVELDNTANIYELLNEAGYDDIEEYRNDKEKYYISKINDNLKLLNLSPIYAPVDELQHLTINAHINGDSFLLFSENDDKIYALTAKNDERIPWLEEKGIKCYTGENPIGGIIISQPEDITLGICFDVNKVPYVKYEHILEKLAKVLSKYYDNITIDNNDILYNGKKVVGAVGFTINNTFTFGAHISLGDSYELLNELGIIKDKIPGYLPNVGDIRNKIMTEIESWLHFRL